MIIINLTNIRAITGQDKLSIYFELRLIAYSFLIIIHGLLLIQKWISYYYYFLINLHLFNLINCVDAKVPRNLIEIRLSLIYSK